MKVIRNINNNVAVCLDDNNHELIAFGKGIGFQKAPYEIELSKIDRTYYNLEPRYLTLLKEFPEDVMDVTFEIVEKGSTYLGMEFNRAFVFALCDHINFAIENFKKGLVISNPMLNELRHLYEKEMLLGDWAVRHIERRLSIKLPRSEAGNIGLHFANAQRHIKQRPEKDDTERFVEDITEIIESEMNIIIDRNEFNYSRFVTHLKFLLKRSNKIDESQAEMDEMYDSIKLAQFEPLMEKIKYYITDVLHIEPGKEELLYLMLHINRLCAREGL